MLNKKRLMNKKGISELISYILLITLTIAIASGTYVWLKSIAVPPQNVECPDVSLWIVNESCYGQSDNSDEIGNLTFFLENKGRIDINGFRIQVSNKTTESIFYDIQIDNSFCQRNSVLNTYLCRINASDTVKIYGTHELRTIELIRITPMKRIDNKEAYCKSFDFQIDDCIA